MKSFEPTEDMIKAAEEVFTRMAVLQTVEPVVLAYQAKILELHQWPIKKEYARSDEPAIILNPSHSFMLSEEHSAIYFQECHKAAADAKLVTKKPENCPMLEADWALRQARKKLIDVMEPISKISYEMASSRIDSLDQCVELLLKLLSPFVSDKPANVVLPFAEKSTA